MVFLLHWYGLHFVQFFFCHVASQRERERERERERRERESLGVENILDCHGERIFKKKKKSNFTRHRHALLAVASELRFVPATNSLGRTMKTEL